MSACGHESDQPLVSTAACLPEVLSSLSFGPVLGLESLDSQQEIRRQNQKPTRNKGE